MVVGIPDTQPVGGIHLHDGREGVPLAQGIACDALVIALECGYAGAPPAADPEPVGKDEHGVHIQAGRPFEVLFHQYTRP